MTIYLHVINFIAIGRAIAFAVAGIRQNYAFNLPISFAAILFFGPNIHRNLHFSKPV
jgi:hypothetical protein